MAPAAGSPADTAAVGTSGSSTTLAYELTGANENQAESFAGRNLGNAQAGRIQCGRPDRWADSRSAAGGCGCH